MNWTKLTVPILALLIGAGGATTVLTLTNSSHAPDTSTPSSSPAGGGGMMGTGGGAGGGGGMMGGAAGMMGGGSDIPSGAPGGLVPASRIEALAAQAAKSATRTGQTFVYHTKRVTLVALGAPGNQPGMYWQLDGVNGPHGPTVSVPADATVNVDFADGDPGHPHGFELTTAAPPYDRMAMMEGRIAASGAFIRPVPPPKGNLW
ncbi:MAG: cupredoxin domain-containing protein, partial [Acidimicrobiales bacterium]